MRWLALSMSYKGIKYQTWGLAGERIWSLDRRWDATHHGRKTSAMGCAGSRLKLFPAWPLERILLEDLYMEPQNLLSSQ